MKAEVEKVPVKKPPVKLRDLYDRMEFVERELKNLRDYVTRIDDSKVKDRPEFLKEIDELKVVPARRKRRKKKAEPVDPVLEAVKQGLKEVDEESTKSLGSFAEYADDDVELDSPPVEHEATKELAKRAYKRINRHTEVDQGPKRRGRPKGSKNRK